MNAPRNSGAATPTRALQHAAGPRGTALPSCLLVIPLCAAALTRLTNTVVISVPHLLTYFSLQSILLGTCTGLGIARAQLHGAQAWILLCGQGHDEG